MAIGISQFQTLYQTYYPDSELPYLLPDHLPLIHALIGGNTDGQVSGDVIDMPWLFGPATGVSQTFGVAQRKSSNAPQSLRPQIRLSQIYKLIDFLDKDEIQSQGEASYGDLMETVVKGVRLDMLSNIDQLAHLSGSGVRAQIATGQGTAVLTVAASGILGTLFEIEDSVVVCSNNPSDGTAPTVVEGPFSVVSVDPDNGTLTLNAAVNASANGQFLAKEGDTLGFSSALLNPSLIGLEAYNPYGGVSTSDSFLGVNRSKYGNRLAGTWFDGSTRSIEAALRRGATNMANTGVGGGGAKAYMNPIDMDALQNKMATYQNVSQAQVGSMYFDSIAINTPLGRLDCISDPHQQQNRVRLMMDGAAQLMYRNGLPHVKTLKSGESEQWGTNFDGRSQRLAGYMQIRVKDPRKLGNIKLAPTT